MLWKHGHNLLTTKILIAASVWMAGKFRSFPGKGKRKGKGGWDWSGKLGPALAFHYIEDVRLSMFVVTLHEITKSPSLPLIFAKAAEKWKPMLKIKPVAFLSLSTKSALLPRRKGSQNEHHEVQSGGFPSN